MKYIAAIMVIAYIVLYIAAIFKYIDENKYKKFK